MRVPPALRGLLMEPAPAALVGMEFAVAVGMEFVPGAPVEDEFADRVMGQGLDLG